MSGLNIKNRTIFCHDNLEILQGINSHCIELVYLDPPFNKNKKFSAPTGSSAAGAGFTDVFRQEDVKDEWLATIKEDYDGLYTYLTSIKNLSNLVSTRKNKHYLYNYCYLAYMAIRLLEIKRILKETGSMYLHCDPTMSHYLKILLDIIFGEKNFKNEIIWGYRTGGVSKGYFPRKHDIILFYTNSSKYKHNPIKETIFYEKPFFISKNAKPNDDGLYPEEVYTRDVWDNEKELKPLINVSKSRTGYPTQKPLALLKRIIQVSTKKGDRVLDPFCGCATTCVASEELGRQWIGIDVGRKAYDLVKERLRKEVSDPEYLLKYQNKIYESTTPPNRTDTGKGKQLEKYVYIISHPKYPGDYKVGIAKNYTSRLNSYQTGDPNREYKLEYTKLTPYFHEIEQHVHRTFENNHEWVKGPLPKLIAEIKNYTPS